MKYPISNHAKRTRSLGISLFIGLAGYLLFPVTASAIPAFARQYSISWNGGFVGHETKENYLLAGFDVTF